MQLTGSEIIIECLKEQGVDTVFGYPGGTILNVYDALYKHSDEIHHVLTSHEQGASHAADGYARATGRVGVCMATSGPGATNLVTGIATAHMDSIPMVAITANVATGLLGRDPTCIYHCTERKTGSGTCRCDKRCDSSCYRIYLSGADTDRSVYCRDAGI